MSSKIRGLPPRVALRIKDSATGSYPTIARTGDSRTGAYSISFDDRETIPFIEHTNLSMPMGLPLDSLHIVEELTSSIPVVPGSVVRGVGDSFAVPVNPGENLGPFIEDSLFEQDQTKRFYTTGSKITETSLGFSTPLKSKTQIRLRLPITASTVLSAQTSSIYYYNNSNQGWERINAGLDINPIRKELPQVAASGEAKLFGLFGNMTLSGTNDVAVRGRSGGNYLFGTPDEDSPGYTTTEADLYVDGVGMSRPLLPPSRISESLNTRDSRYAATSEHLITPEVQHPFLIEKVVVKIPIEAGPGWTDDRTTAEYVNTSSFSYGGPALTLALQRQVLSDRREVICSGTIIPLEDNVSASFMTDVGETSPQGFLCFSTPAAVLSPDVNGHFTGSALMEIVPAICNGMISFGRDGAKVYGTEFTGSVFIGVKPFGRAGDGRVSGRSFFGKGFMSPGSDNTEIRPLYEDVFTTERLFYVAQSNVISPYLLLPGDKVFFSLSKSRPVHLASELLTEGYGGTLTGSHDVKLADGRMDVTLYGSLIRNHVEFHDTLNQPLTSVSIHEALHYDNPVVDQYDIEDRGVFSGSYVSEIISGTLDEAIQTRGVEGSVLDRRSLAPLTRIIHRKDVGEVSGSLMRGVKLVSPSERYWDTILPRPDMINAINGGDILQHATTGSVGWLQLGPRSGFGQENGGYDSNTDDTWYRSFPFEARYSTVIRTTAPFRKMRASKILKLSGVLPLASGTITEVGILEPIWRAEGFHTEGPTLSNTIFQDLGGLYSPVRTLEMIRAYYGIGEGLHGSAKFIDLSNADSNGVQWNHYNFVQIRGWKYGLMSGLPINSSAVFRRDRYGQFRDMLEQRKDSKFQISEIDPNGNVGFTAVGSSPIKIIFSEPDPEDTMSSNMSLEATSSLPFFDADRGDEGRNRGALPSVEAVRFSA